MVIDTKRGSLFLTKRRVRKIKQLVKTVIQHHYSPLMTLARLFGLMVSNTKALQWGRLQLRPLQLLLRLFQLNIMEKWDISVLVL